MGRQRREPLAALLAHAAVPARESDDGSALGAADDAEAVGRCVVAVDALLLVDLRYRRNHAVHDNLVVFDGWRGVGSRLERINSACDAMPWIEIKFDCEIVFLWLVEYLRMVGANIKMVGFGVVLGLESNGSIA